jgi:hypothetical protein
MHNGHLLPHSDISAAGPRADLTVGATKLANELATPAEPVRQQEVAQQEVA